MARATLYALAASALLALTLTHGLAAAVGFRLDLLAVSDEGEGVVVPVEISVSLASPVLIVEPLHGVAGDTRLSIKVSWKLVRLLTGVENLAVRVVFGGEEVSGASAGSVFAAALLASVAGLRPDPLRTGTGVVSPLGLVLPVQGLAEKLRAAASHGVAVVYVPPQPFERVEGLRVVSVCTVFDAEAVLAGAAALTTVSLGPSELRAFDEGFRDDAELLIGIAKELGLNVSRALEALEKGHYYAAASLAFSVISDSADEALPRILRAVGAASVESLLARAAVELNNAIEEASARGCIEVDDLIALIEASYRLYVAERAALNETRKGFAALRALTALSWLNETGATRTPCVGFDAVARAATLLVDYASTVYDYARELVGDAVREMRMDDGRTVEEWLRDAAFYAVSGNHVRAIALAARVVEAIDVALSTASLGPGASECYRRLVEQLASLTLFRGVASAMPLLYYDYAGIADPEYEPLLYASAASRLLALLAVAGAGGAAGAEAEQYHGLPEAVPMLVIIAAVASTVATGLRLRGDEV